VQASHATHISSQTTVNQVLMMHGSSKHAGVQPWQQHTMRNSIILILAIVACGTGALTLARNPGTLRLGLDWQTNSGAMKDANQDTKVMSMGAGSREQMAGEDAGATDNWSMMGGGPNSGSMMGRGSMMGPGSMMGGGSASSVGCPGKDYMQMFHSLLNAHKQIQRTYKETPEGIVSVTESDDPQVARWIQLHVEQMRELM
jgi:hypothetical protein